MSKATKIATCLRSCFQILILLPTLLFSQNAIVGPGFSTRWDSGSCNDTSHFKN
jgi:hypothetical protein